MKNRLLHNLTSLSSLFPDKFLSILLTKKTSRTTLMRIPLFFDYLPDGSIRHTDDVDAAFHLIDTHTAHIVDGSRLRESRRVGGDLLHIGRRRLHSRYRHHRGISIVGGRERDRLQRLVVNRDREVEQAIMVV